MNNWLRSMSRVLQISIRFEQANAFARLPKREEVVRQDVGEYIKNNNLDTDGLEAVILYY
jgi:hypothetical protein